MSETPKLDPDHPCCPHCNSPDVVKVILERLLPGAPTFAWDGAMRCLSQECRWSFFANTAIPWWRVREAQLRSSCGTPQELRSLPGCRTPRRVKAEPGFSTATPKSRRTIG